MKSTFLGKWVSPDMVRLFCGEIRGNGANAMHYIVSFNVQVRDGAGVVRNVSPVGVFTNQKKGEFLRAIGVTH